MKRILVVEDAHVLAADMCATLSEHGSYRCAVAADGPEAVHLGRTFRPHLALVDLTLARGTDGIATARELSGRFQIPVLFVTGQTHRVADLDFALGCLEKPVSYGALTTAVDAVFARMRGDAHRGDVPAQPNLRSPTGAAPLIVPAEGEARFRAVFEHAPHGIAVVNLDGQLVDVNAALAGIEGVPRETLVGAAAAKLSCLTAPIAQALAACLAGERDAVPSIDVPIAAVTGAAKALRVHGQLIRDPFAQPRFCVLHVQDVTAERALEAELRRAASTDPLTGLANRARFDERLRETYARLARGRDQAALLLIDLDEFKRVNDSHGHLAGDDVLRAVAGRLTSRLRRTDMAARLGGDEFAAVLEPSSCEAALVVARDLLELFATAVELNGGRANPGACIGISPLDARHGTIEHCIRRADQALYAAKRRGPASIEVWGRPERPLARLPPATQTGA